ncbi:hypothetical protein DUI87_17671 [Hirundo rustica rustica]|uniref:ribonuclease H n=1 Tax=Hirundo rustica rustica TaxID=333673 RepID=A0A3M0JX79_HIRRU|nr:hypothetical protein DUI87_17671 [Hirundo rustica rustica]
MKNSPVICQWYVASLLSPVHAAAGQAIIHHYMDDVLVCAPTDDVLSHALDLTINALIAAGFELQEEKVQRMPPWKYLGLEIGKQTIVPQKLAIKTKKTKLMVSKRNSFSTQQKFEDDTKLSGVVARPEGCNAILGDLDKFEKWVHEVSGGFVRGSASFGMWVGANPAITQKANHILGCIKSSVGSRAREMIHLFSSDVQFLCTSECTYSAASRPVSPTPTIQYLKGDYKKDIEGLF